MYLGRKYWLWTLFLRLLLETGPPFYVVIRATRRFSRLKCKEISFISQLFLKTLSNGPASGIEPATSRSAVMRSTDWADPACSVWDSKQCKVSKYVHRNTLYSTDEYQPLMLSNQSLYTVVLSHCFRSRSYEEKLSRKSGSPSSRVNGKNSWPLCPSQKYSHMLRLSRLERVDPAGEPKCLRGETSAGQEGDLTFKKGWTSG